LTQLWRLRGPHGRCSLFRRDGMPGKVGSRALVRCAGPASGGSPRRHPWRPGL